MICQKSVLNANYRILHSLSHQESHQTTSAPTPEALEGEETVFSNPPSLEVETD